jgi:cytochrome c-type biogenesis protein CcmF
VAVLSLMAIGPMFPWRHAGKATVKALRWPIAAAAVVAAVLLVTGLGWAAIAIGLAAGGVATVATEYARALRRKPRLLVIRRRRYGAYLAHVGVLVVAIGIAASQFGQQEKDATLQPGESVSVAGYTLTYTGEEQRQLADHTEYVAAMHFGNSTLAPSRATYAGLGGQALTHVAISTTPLADVYVVLAGTNADGSASFRVFINPLVTWIWAGGVILILGVVLGNAGEREVAAELARRRIPITLPA